VKRLACLILLSCVACSHGSERQDDPNVIEPPPGRYSTILNHWTDSDKAYSGLSAVYEVTATLMALEVVEHQVYLDAEQLKWTPERYRDAKQKALFEAQTEATVFVSLYTGKNENNDLDKTKTIWNIFLNADGKRFEPKSIKRIHDNQAQLLAKFPYHNVWSRAYMIKFSAQTSVVTSSSKISLTLASPLGSSELKFPQ
jgi:hypothetical protein